MPLIKVAITAAIIGLGWMPIYAETAQNRRVDAVTGAGTWETQAHGVYFSLTQILPEQIQAFYVNRGFTLEQIKPYVSSCVFMTILRNDHAPGTIHFISNNWKVNANGRIHLPPSIENWITYLATEETKASALIAFRWAQFPSEQEYEPGGDWNQGMLSMGLPSGSQFDISARWDIEDRILGSTEYEVNLQQVECAQ